MLFSIFNKKSKKESLSLKNKREMQKKAPKLHDAFEIIEKYSPTGAKIMAWAKKNDVGFKPKTNDLRALGLCHYASNTISINDNNNVPLNVSILSHEIMHMIQAKAYKTNRTAYYLNWDYRTVLLHNRAVEASAETCAIKVCYEAKLNGYKNAFEESKIADKKWGYKVLYELFEDNYEKAIKNNLTQSEALEKASDKTFNAYYKLTNVTQNYNDECLKRLIQNILSNDFQKLPSYAGFGEEGSKKLSEVVPNEFLTSTIKPDLSDKGLFNGDENMRQAFEYVEYIKTTKTYDKANFGVQRQLMLLEQDQNPYLTVDLNAVLSALNNKNASNSPIKIMNEIVGLPNSIQLEINLAFPRTQPKFKGGL